MPILTSTVIECHRVGFQKAAFSYASMLMRSEYRSQIDQKYTKKIEAIVRKTPRGVKDSEDAYQDETQKCPLCDFDLPIMELACSQCKTTLPICVATVILPSIARVISISNQFSNVFQGQHISRDYLAACPACDFLCFKPQMTK